MNARSYAVALGIILVTGGAAGAYVGHNRGGGSTSPSGARWLVGRILSTPDGGKLCCGKGSLLGGTSPRRGAAAWILSGVDCTACAAQQLGYWRRLAEECGGPGALALAVFGVGKDTATVSSFAGRYRFPGSVHAISALEDVGLAGATTPLVVLVDSASRVVLVTGAVEASNPSPQQLLVLSDVLGGCRQTIQSAH